MKKLFITIAFVAATMFASAQFFVGGNLGLDFGSAKLESTKVASTFGFTIAPGVGYMFNDNMGVGVDILFSSDKVTNKVTDAWTKTTNFGIEPYFRYVFAEVDNFKFYADARFNYNREKDSAKDDDGHGDKTTDLGINIVPGMQYNFTDNISMVARLNVLRLGWNMSTLETYDPVDDKNVKYKTSGFGLGINENTPLMVGFVYTF